VIKKQIKNKKSKKSRNDETCPVNDLI